MAPNGPKFPLIGSNLKSPHPLTYCNFPSGPALDALNSRKTHLQPPGAVVTFCGAGRECGPAWPRRFRFACEALLALFTSEPKE